jgi:hypothetical protein
MCGKLSVMARTGDKLGSVRFSRRETGWLMAALLLSLFMHLAAWGGYEAGKKYGWWNHLQLPAWLHRAEKTNPPPPAPAQRDVEPVIFVEVSHADTEPPKKTIYYSNKNSQSANPEADKDSNRPKLNGSQKNVPKTEDTPQLAQLQPTPPQPPATDPQQAETSPMNLGDLKLNQKPADNNARSQNAQTRPRTLKQAQQQLPGQQMKQDGGVRRQLRWSSLDVKATAFGDYDRAIVEAVTQHWYDLLDSRQFAQDRTGEVILKFKLKFDGSVEDVVVLENTVGEMLSYVCQQAIQEAAPFAQWPADMRRMIGANYREVTFTFYYY